MTDTAEPLVTFALLAYNQEQFIREAVEGAFAQTYAPLEIILSDDCSTDRTFEIMQQMAESYAGPHFVRINKNAQNIGLANHVNFLVKIIRTELVVLAAGDDISENNRVESIFDVWKKNPGVIQLIHSSCLTIDCASNVVQRLDPPDLGALDCLETAAREGSFIIGATEAFSINLFRLFGGFRGDLVHEDRALVFRALLAGGKINFIPSPLVRYRQGIGLSGLYGSPSHKAATGGHFRKKILGRFLIDYLQKADDLKFVENQLIESIVQNKICRYKFALDCEDGVTFFKLIENINKVGWLFLFKMLTKRFKNIISDGFSV